MVRPDIAKWNQSIDDLRRRATESLHARTRERFLALYMIVSGQRNATPWAAEIGRENETVMNWVHRYNASGPEALIYRRSGGTTPFLRPNRSRRFSKFSIPIRTRTACPEPVGL